MNCELHSATWNHGIPPKHAYRPLGDLIIRRLLVRWVPDFYLVGDRENALNALRHCHGRQLLRIAFNVAAERNHPFVRNCSNMGRVDTGLILELVESFLAKF